MRAKDWEILKIGDRVTRVVRTPCGITPGCVEERDEFQVMQIKDGEVVAVRLVSRAAPGGTLTVMTESVSLGKAAACAPRVIPEGCTAEKTYEWEWNAPAHGEARLTGGFVVTRADGSVERDRCPTDTTR